jgi:hypothetical protein
MPKATVAEQREIDLHLAVLDAIWPPGREAQIEEISEITGMKYSTVGHIANRGLEKIRKMVRRGDPAAIALWNHYLADSFCESQCPIEIEHAAPDAA